MKLNFTGEEPLTDETGLYLCHYCEEEAIISITGISEMYLCNDAHCAQQCLYSELGEEPIEY